MYHSIDDSGSMLSVSPRNFRIQLEWLRGHGWRGLTSAEYVARQHGVPGSSAEVFISFDDGYETTLQVAAPILAEFGFPATVLVPTDLVGTRPSCFVRDSAIIRAQCGYVEASDADLDAAIDVTSQIPLLSWEQLGEIRGRGIDVECHGAAHHFMTRLPDSHLLQELRRSRQALKDRLGVDSQIIAYPYGDWDSRVTAAARAAGFAVGLLADRSGPEHDCMAILRLGMNDAVTTEDLGHFLSLAGEYEEALLRRLRPRRAA
jgi:peptidoglycan/xylan/chitin deacetylase (PgdA/CDA1 family)